MLYSISTLSLATGGAFLGKFVGLTAEHLGNQALERAQQLGTKAKAILAQLGREPQTVEPKILMPLIKAAVLESDETLAEMWARLLASAADPISKVKVQLGFVAVLRQLDSTDPTILNWMYLRLGKDLIGYDEVPDTYVLDTEVFESLGYREGLLLTTTSKPWRAWPALTRT
jgi:hypothetical protein